MVHSDFKTPTEVVGWLGAVQAQDFGGAKWSLGLRIPNSNEASIEKAFQEGSILRTHLLRPTWHFVIPADIRWLLKLTGPRVHIASAFMYRKVELDQTVFKKSNAAMEKALQGGKQMTRDELRAVLTKAGIRTEGEQRMTYLMMQAELDGVVCSGPRDGKQFTYMLLEERVLQVKKLTRDDALARLAARYFTSRGPASVQDFAKWSGLTMADAKHGIESIGSQFQKETIHGQTYWFMEHKGIKIKSPVVHLLSIYDEYISSYKDRSAMGDEKYAEKLRSMGNALTYIMTLDGQIIGTWKRTLEKRSVIIKPDFFVQLKKVEKEAFHQTAAQYAAFLDLPLVLESK
jgi:hypothetical protein